MPLYEPCTASCVKVNKIHTYAWGATASTTTKMVLSITGSQRSGPRSDHRPGSQSRPQTPDVASVDTENSDTTAKSATAASARAAAAAAVAEATKRNPTKQLPAPVKLIQRANGNSAANSQSAASTPVSGVSPTAAHAASNGVANAGTASEAGEDVGTNEGKASAALTSTVCLAVFALTKCMRVLRLSLHFVCCQMVCVCQVVVPVFPQARGKLRSQEVVGKQGYKCMRT